MSTPFQPDRPLADTASTPWYVAERWLAAGMSALLIAALALLLPVSLRIFAFGASGVLAATSLALLVMREIQLNRRQP